MFMKQLSLFYMVVLMCFTMACTHQEFEEEVVKPTDGYIYFNTEVNSRGTLVTELSEKSFGVFGYNYSNEVDWNTVKVQAKPNVFYKKEITWNGAFHEYKSPVAWSPNHLYTFMGYYPYGNSNLVPSEDQYEGDPYLTYTMPTDNKVANMVDVMTASIYNTDNSQSKQVGIRYKHRLVAMDVQARNFNEKEGEEFVYIKVTFLKMKFENLKYNSAKLMMDASLNADIFYEPTSQWKPVYTLVNNPIIVPPSRGVSGDVEPTYLTGTEANTTLIFLPQSAEEGESFLKGEVTYSYEFVDVNGNPITVKINNEDVASVNNQTISFDTGKNMVAGRKYIFQMTFSRSTITIAVVESDEWTDHNVNIDFE